MQLNTLVCCYSPLHSVWVQYVRWLASGSSLAELCGQWLPWEKFFYNIADWQLSPKLMRSRFLSLLTPVVFTARLSSGRLRWDEEADERREMGGALIIYDPSSSSRRRSQSCFHFAPLRYMCWGWNCVRATLMGAIFTGTVSMSRNRSLWCRRHVNSSQIFTAHTVLTHIAQGQHDHTRAHRDHTTHSIHSKVLCVSFIQETVCKLFV